MKHINKLKNIFLTQKFGKNKITDINQHWHGCEKQKILYFVKLVLPFGGYMISIY